MKKGLLIGGAVIGVILLFIIIVGIWSVGTYNKMVTQNERVLQTWAQVENQYQRRTDLIPNLVNTVKGYANFEKDVLTRVTEARASVTSIKATPELINDPQAFRKFQEAQANLGGALSRLLATVENYPNLKANEGFLNLQAQLEGTENRITVARKSFNDEVQTFNTMIKRFPAFIFAGMSGFREKEYFKAVAGSETAPKVEF